MKKQGWLWAAALAAIFGVGGWFITRPDPEPVLSGLEIVLGNVGLPGDQACILGVSVRDPLNRDGSGLTIDQSPMADRFFALPISSYRHTAGSASYKVTSVYDEGMQYCLADVLPRFSAGVTNDFTWPPSLPNNGVAAWVTARTGRISLPNEPPIHIGPGKEFSTPEDYVNHCVAVYQAPENAAFKNSFYIQSGKPELIAASGSPPSVKQKHLQVQTALAAAVQSGRLPSRIITTHKLMDYGQADWYGFYNSLLNDYEATYGNGVQVCFQEWNWLDADDLTDDILVDDAHFLLVLSRLRYERGGIVDGASYHQGSALKGTALIGIAAEGGEWAASELTELWESFGNLMLNGSYVSSKIADKPSTLAVEVFELDKKRWLLYSNRGPSVELAIKGTQTKTWGAEFYSSAGETGLNIPGNSCGIVALN